MITQENEKLARVAMLPVDVSVDTEGICDIREAEETGCIGADTGEPKVAIELIASTN